MQSIRLTAALAALGLALGAAAVTSAGAGQAQTTLVAQAETYSDAKLQSFAVAALQVQKIRQDYVGRIQKIDDKKKRHQLATEANTKMVDVIKASPGITVEEYNAIIRAASNDKALTERISKQLNAAAK
jgi:hypothetical protein